MKAAIWARVSTTQQETDNQTRVLKELIAGRGFELVHVYEIDASAYSGKHEPELEKLYQDARRGRFHYLFIWSLDRLSRQGVIPTYAYLEKLWATGITVVSQQEPWLEAPSDFRPLMIALVAWAAHFESRRKSERLKAWAARRRELGLPMGRPAGIKDSSPRKKRGYYARWAK